MGYLARLVRSNCLAAFPMLTGCCIDEMDCDTANSSTEMLIVRLLTDTGMLDADRVLVDPNLLSTLSPRL